MPFRKLIYHILTLLTLSKYAFSNPIILDSVLRPFVNKICYVVLRNHPNADLVVSSIPLLSQHWKPEIVSVETVSSKNVGQILWIKSHTNRVNQLEELRSQRNTTLLCRSNILFKRTTSDICSQSDPCTIMRRKRWILGGRPGNCIIQIDFHLPSSLKIHLYNFPFAEYYIPYGEPTLPQIHLLIRPFSTPNRDIRSWYFWKQCPDVSMETRMVINFLSYINSSNSSTFKIERADILSRGALENIVPIAMWEKLTDSKLSDFEVMPTQNPHHWDIWRKWSRSKYYSRFSSILSNCFVDVSYKAKYVHPSAIENRILKMDRAHAHILHLVMGNFSYVTPGGYSCKYPGTLEEKYTFSPMATILRMDSFDERKKLSENPLMLFNHSLLNIRFVVCGDRGRDAYAFKQLTNAFELNSWVGLFLTYVAGAILLPRLQIEIPTSQLGTFLEFFKVLVEQGDPFPQKLLKQAKHKFVIGCVLLTGIALSNAYKNVNVYNMALPRQPVKYQNIKQLLQDNIACYSRISRVRYELLWQNPFGSHLQRSREQWETRYFVPSLSGPDQGTSIRLNMPRHNISITYNLEFYSEELHELAKYGEPPVISVVYVTEHPAAQEMIKWQLGKVNSNQQIRMERADVLQKTYSNWEEMHFITDLMNCSRLTVFVPEVAAMRYKMKFEAGGNGRLDISRQVIKWNLTGLSFRGLITRSIRARIIRIQQAAIMLRWETLYNINIDKQGSLDRIKVSPAALTGNIFVIFAVFLAGTTLSILAYFTELYIIC